ncbi:hypothetical protein [Methanorbis rubei]|uniref:hypothetical protein n=1 Tax=Methanorbis rubei TaxID=3028300 RepID=UPI0030B8C3CB
MSGRAHKRTQPSLKIRQSLDHHDTPFMIPITIGHILGPFWIQDGWRSADEIIG